MTRGAKKLGRRRCRELPGTKR